MITLLLALFIVMYSMSKIDAEKFKNVTSALAGQLKGGETIFEKSLGSSIVGTKILNIRELRLLNSRINEKLQVENLNRNKPIAISTQIDERGLVIHIEESALFESGKDELKPEAYEPLKLIAQQLATVDNPVRVEGHTDDRPIKTPRFPSNWELSAARATNVVRYFIEKHNLPPDKLSALGYGEYRPIAGNDTPEGRAQNRRVDIVVLSQSEMIKEPPIYHSDYDESEF
jgi:chemotaxis protein MotB